MSQTTLGQAQIATIAREQEDVVVTESLIVRHKASVRLTHWLVAIFFFLAMLTGFAIFTPFLFGLTGLFGGGAMTRTLHPWFSLGFVIAVVFLFRAWRERMKPDAGDQEWKENMGAYMRYEVELEQVGKYNAGQKMFFWAVALGALAFLLSGIVMWFPATFPFFMRTIAYWLHEATFVAFVIGIIYHIYISTTAMPGTLRAMTRGTVTKAWAKWHHPRWYREVTGKK
ncbi:MAG TPA: formate dehydrogenase subunit gamma [Blastocatellia bacterium]|nr:formate dehydrogenase subunit gamma [Blastocatellia bacterium]